MSEALHADRAAELERHRQEVRNGWRISQDLGRPRTEAEKTWEMLTLEAKFYCTATDFMIGQSIASHAKRYLETGNPFYVDAADVLCGLAGIDPLPALLPLMREVATKRLRNETRAGTAAQVARKGAKSSALNLMTILCAAGATREEAASKAAKQLALRGAPTFTASSLYQFYKADELRRIEGDRKRYFATEEGSVSLEEWKRILPLLPEADDR